ncbi:MAG: tyrosine recombinase [Epsilonproteobacteria bacterium]|nr:tyrosine recombinase [Campylobacterota bacterium]|tara:strand:+ start:1713 stop:2633 length:921 start_codon:yes stop_codon:yes gene_type:complete
MKHSVDLFLYHLMSERYLSSNTVEAYRRDIQQFLDFIQKKTKVTTFKKINNQHIKDFLKHLKYRLKVGPKSASRKLSALKSLSKYLHKVEKVPLFTEGVAFPKLPQQLPKFLSEEQVQDILLAADKDTSLTGKRNKVMIALLYACGLRVSELLSLQIHNVHFSEHFIQVFGKGDKERIVPLPEEILPALQFYIAKIQPALIASAGETIMTDHLFPVVYGQKVEPMTRQGFHKILKIISAQAGLVHPVSAHVLRHSLATHLLKKGANLRVLQMLLGHEKLTTVQVYTHLDVSHLQSLYNTFHPRAKK